MFSLALEYKPDAYWVFNNLGIAFLLMKQENEAISSFETAGSNCQRHFATDREYTYLTSI